MTKKYHIFIGTTADDLKLERRELPRIIMELGHIPVSAEYFDASGSNVELLVKKTIEECDYFIALTAYKYSPAGAKTAPLETEYNYAVKAGVPVLALVIDEKARWKASKKETESGLIKKLENFKKKLLSGTHVTWLTAADLRQKAQNLLIQEMNLNPKEGWVRGNAAIDPSVANELSRLSGENEILKHQIKIESGEMVAKLREQVRHALKALSLNMATLSFYYTTGDNWENTTKFRYLRIFKLLAPELSLGKTTAEISRFLGSVLNPDLEKTVRKDYPTPSNTIKKIMSDFSLLKLVKCSGSNPAEASVGEIWEITEYGKELYSAYRMRQLERAFVKKDS
ncbi:MAG: DUF4062 domain-containing protein [Treponema sp.]|jgi:hypothetical protein|nr:DUF4062 domain-containing protein [Treponema sp.]